jgi:putative transposase
METLYFDFNGADRRVRQNRIMIIRRGYKFQLKTNAQQNECLSRFAGCSRLVWNQALALQKNRLDQHQRALSYEELAGDLVAWKKEQPFLKEVHSQPLQQTLKDLDRATKDAFKKDKGFPKFKKKGQHDSFKFPQGIKLDGNRIYLPKLGWFRFRKSREIEGTVKNVTVSRTLDKWYVSIQVELEVPEPVHPTNSTVGIDMGVVRFATLSDGTVIKPIDSFRKLEKKLTRAQRKLARQIKFSCNWKKQKRKIQKIHYVIGNVRKDFLHKVTSEISKNHAIVVLEDLKIRNMTGSAKGTLDAPGKNVAAKAGLNKAILDQGWYEFQRQLTYKEQWMGGHVVLINPVNTSRTCSDCKHVAKESRRSQAIYECVNCGNSDNADLNAAKNILAAGHAVIACGDIRRVAA